MAAQDRLALWQQTHDLGTALGVDAARLGQSAASQITQLLSSLPAAQAGALLASLHDQLADQAFGPDQVQSALQSAIRTAVPAGAVPQVVGPVTIPAAPGAVAPDPAAPAADAGPDLSPAGATAPGQQHLPVVNTPGAPAVPGDASLGTLAAYMGTDASQLRQQYQAYLGLFRRGQRVPGRFREGADTTEPQSLSDWVHSQLVALEGSYTGLLNAYDAAYQATYGAAMPPDLRAQLRQALLSAPPEARSQANAIVATGQGESTGATNAGQTALGAVPNFGGGTGALPFLDTIVKNYVAAHPKQQDEATAQAQAYVDSFYKTFGRMPSQADIAKFGTMSAQDFQDYMNAQPYRAGLNYGVYSTAKKMFEGQWLDAFGKQPTDAQYAQMAGMSQQEFTDWLNQQPSRITGLNYGDYSSARKALDGPMQAEFGHAATDELVRYFHEAQTA